MAGPRAGTGPVHGTEGTTSHCPTHGPSIERTWRSLTQVRRALDEAGIGWIGARSAQAKGRVERLWGTLQDRLVSELRV